MGNNEIEATSSPCVGICTMNDMTGLCEGCYRTIDEIREWWSMPLDERAAVMQRLEQRQRELLNFGD